MKPYNIAGNKALGDAIIRGLEKTKLGIKN
jgi:hypothetical protein